MKTSGGLSRATSGGVPRAARISMCAWLAVASCQCQEHPMVSKDGLEIETTITADDEHLFLRYAVTNRETTTVYLLNRVHATDESGQQIVNKDLAYVYVDGSGVHVEKGIPEIPRGTAPYEPVTPYVTPLRGGASFEETVELPLPLLDSRPYRGGPPSADRVSVDEVRFSLGFMRVPEGTTEQTLPVGDTTEIVFRTPPGTDVTAGTLETTSPIHAVDGGARKSVAAILPQR